MSTADPPFGTDEILWYDNGKWGDAGYALANPNGKIWTNNSGFNSAIAAGRESLWAVAVPVTVHLEGDPQPGSTVRGHVFAAGGEQTSEC